MINEVIKLYQYYTGEWPKDYATTPELKIDKQEQTEMNDILSKFLVQ